MKLFKKVALGAGVALMLSSTNLSAAVYTVESGDTLKSIVIKLGFDSLDASGIKTVPSGNFNKIFPGDEIEYAKKKKKKRFSQKKQKTKSTKFCFKDNRSIHYRASERCK